MTTPAAGVIATRPTIAPMHAPIADIFRFVNRSKNIQVIILVAEATFVLANATTASKLAPKAEPALKPNHPNQSNPVPRITNGIFAGFSIIFFLFPRNKAPASAANPADI